MSLMARSDMARGAIDLSVVVVVVSSILSLFLDLIVAILVDLAADDLAVELVLGRGDKDELW